MIAARRGSLLALGLWAASGEALVGCNTPITAGDSFETSLFTFRASVAKNDVITPESHPLVGVVWSDPLERQPDVVMPGRWLDVVGMQGDPSLGDLTVRIYRPPPPAAVVEIAGPMGTAVDLAFGEVVLVDDANGDGAFVVPAPRDAPRGTIAPPDSYFAASPFALVYLPRAFSPTTGDFPLLPPLGSGYHFINYHCNGTLSNGLTVATETTLDVRPGTELPESRSCMRSHSP